MSTDPQPVYDDYYNDPAATIVLKSKDGVLFRMSAHVMRRTCDLFADIAPFENDTAVEPISLDAQADTVRFFLDVITTIDMSSDHFRRWESPKQPFEFFDIAIYLQSYRVIYAMVHRMKGGWCSTKDMWVIFAIASRLDDVDIAKWALRGVGAARQSVNGQGSREWFEPHLRQYITDTYASELLRVQLWTYTHIPDKEEHDKIKTTPDGDTFQVYDDDRVPKYKEVQFDYNRLAEVFDPRRGGDMLDQRQTNRATR